ncbi:MAG: leucine-rich repeat protein [Acutalibacteraceae bacterium]|nr:leucine-rich repeat protein [Acutalibacteraceae bacterium]
MTISKRIVSIFLCLILAVTNFAVIAGAEEVAPPDAVYLENGLRLKLTTVYEETAYMVSQSEKKLSGDIVIPEEYMGVPIRKINSSAFSYCDDVTSVTMPDTVWEIMDGAFNSCPNLKWINISKGVIDIDNNAFLAMHGLEELRMGGELNGEGRRFSYNTGFTTGVQLGYMNYFVRDGILFSNDSLYLTSSGYKSFDNIKIEYYPQGRKNEIYKIPNDVVSTDLYCFLSPVYLRTLVVPLSVRSFTTKTLYYYDSNARDKLSGPVNVVFQHDNLPESVKGWYYNDAGVKKSVTVPLYAEGGFLYDSWDGSQLIFKNDAVCAGFAEKNIAKDAKSGDGGTELPSFVVAPKATDELKLDTFIDEIDLDDTVTIFATQSPLDTTDDLEFSTADENIAAFDGFSRGYLSGVSVGTTTYYVKSGDKVVQHDITVTCDHIDRNGNSTLSEWTQTKAPTCTEDGVEVITCAQEGCKQVVETRAIDKLNHTKNGVSAYEFVKAVDATCEEGGYTLEKCSLCNNEQEVDIVTALGHDYATGDDWTIDKDAECTEAGSKSHHCSRCESKIDITGIPALNHTHKDGSSAYKSNITRNPDCTNEGERTFTCSLCSDAYKETIKANGHTETAVVTAPTCTEKGYTTYTCSVCGEARVTDYVDALGHNEVVDKAVEPNCTETGLTKGVHCSVCSDVLIAQEIVPALGHTEVVDKPVAPTCTETGLTEGKHCSVCNEVLVAQETVPSTGHSYGGWVIDVNPTCTEVGSKHKTCSKCSDVKTEEISSLGHIYSTKFTVDVEATCYAEGSKSYHCTNDGCESKTEITVIPTLEHEYGDWVIDTPATCEKCGSRHKTCINCPDTVTETIVSTGHSESDWIIGEEAKCGVAGYEYKVCTVCGNETERKELPALEHDFSGEWITTVPATCQTTGQKYTVCKNCSAECWGSIPVDKNNHANVVIDKAIEPTCTSDGLTEGSHCSECTKVIVKQQVVPALGHTSSDWIVDVVATCSSVGSKYKECTVCHEKLDSEVVPVIPHKYSNWETINEPTCAVDGLKRGVCSCGDTVDKVIPAYGHTYSSEWTIDKVATCTENGSKSHHCINKGCDSKSDVTVITTTHNEKAVVTAPTCTEKGYTTFTCTVCGNTRKADYVNAKGHRETNWLVDKTPTCTSTGSKHIECADCGITIETATTSKLPHTEGKWITDKKATTSSDGKKHLECKICGATMKTATIKQLACSKPKLSKIENTSSGVKISWNKTSGADSYRVYRKTSKSGWKHIGSTSKLYYTDKTAKSGTKYYYAVKARNEVGNSNLSSSKSIYHLADPTLKTPTSSRSGITLKWNRITGAQGYVIYRKTADGSYKKIATVKGSTKVSYVDKSAKKGKKYTYKVKAYYSKTYSAYSNTKTIKDKY